MEPSLSNVQWDQQHLRVTPAGAYFAVSARDEDPFRAQLLTLLARSCSRPSVATASIHQAPSTTEGAPTRELLDRLLQLGWIELAAEAETAAVDSLEHLLPELLPTLSAHRCALLADHQGLQIGFAGFDETQAQGLAALSAEAIALGLRHRQLVHGSSGRTPAAWAMVDAAGNSQIGVWPLFLGDRWFALVIGGRPLFTSQAFQRLVRTLVQRAGAAPPPPRPAVLRAGKAF